MIQGIQSDDWPCLNSYQCRSAPAWKRPLDVLSLPLMMKMKMKISVQVSTSVHAAPADLPQHAGIPSRWLTLGSAQANFLARHGYLYHQKQ